MRTVTVTGHGEARVAPDSAVVRVSAVHRSPGVAEALAGADSAAGAIATTARQFTTPERVGSTSLQIWRDHDESGPAGFSARHSLVIGCSDIEAAGGLLTALVETVGDRLEIEGVSLEVADQAAGILAAREAAYADAVDRATHLVALAGAALGDVQEVVEGGDGTVPVGRLAKAMSAQASFQPGETSIGSSVTVTFQLR